MIGQLINRGALMLALIEAVVPHHFGEAVALLLVAIVAYATTGKDE